MVMYAGAIAVPLVLGSALHLTKEDVAFLINADLFCCGLVSLIQSVGVWKIGIRMPVMMGVTFASIGPMVAIASAPGRGLPDVFGATLAAGACGFLLAPLVGRLRRFFPPIVTGSTIIAIGLSLMGVAAGWAAGGPGNSDAGSPIYLAIAAGVMLFVLIVVRFTSGFIGNIAILLGLVVGYALSWCLGLVSLQGMAGAAPISLVAPFHFGLPRFSFWPVAAMCMVMLVCFVESTGMFMALGEITGRRITGEDLVRAYRADAVGTAIGGLFNTFPYTSYAQNIGLVAVTGVKDKWVCGAAGLLLVLLSLFPKMAFLVASVPPFVIGGVGIIMFGMVAANGIKVLAREDLNDPRNLYIISISLGLGLIPVIYPGFFARLPSQLAPVLHSPVLLTALSAVLLTLFLRGPRPPRLLPTEGDGSHR